MKNFLKITSIIISLLVFSNNSVAAEKAEYLKTDWSFKGLFENLIEHHYKEVIKFIPKYALLVIQ